MKILSIDPGDRTGFAWLDTDYYTSFRSWETISIHKAIDSVRRELPSVSTVVVEDFIISSETHKKSKPQHWPLELIGVVAYLCRSEGVLCVRQQPAQRLWMDNDKLKALGWYKGAKKATDTQGHADDAARHLGVYLGAVKQDQDFLRRLCEWSN